MARIKHFVTPRYLYRYRSVSNISRELDSIRNQYIYAASYESMNDPMEGLYEAHGASSELRSWMDEREWRLFAPTVGRQSYKRSGPTRTSIKVARAIYLGSRIDDADRALVIELAAAKGLKVFDLIVDGYALSAEPVE